MLPMVTVLAVVGSYIEPVYWSPKELREVKAILRLGAYIQCVTRIGRGQFERLESVWQEPHSPPINPFRQAYLNR